MQPIARRCSAWTGLALAFLVGACGGDTPSTQPDERVAPFVGLWEASEFTVTSVADPPQVADLLMNGSFTIDIQPSGTYTATLVLGELSPAVEIGQLVVTGDLLRLRPNGPDPCPASSEYTFSGPDHFTLSGPTCFDFNLDGEDEDAVAFIALDRK